MWRRALVALALVLPIATVPVVHGLDLLDDRLPARKTERLLREELGTKQDFRCRPVDEDGGSTLDDVDYVCDGDEDGYLVGTDGDGITGVQWMG